MEFVARYYKAVFGGIGAAVAFAIPVVDDGLLASEWLGVALAFLGGAGLVAAAPRNREPAG